MTRPHLHDDPTAGSADVPASVLRQAFGSLFGYHLLVDGTGVVRAASASAEDLFEGCDAVGRGLGEGAWDDLPRVEDAVERASAGLFDRFVTTVARDGAHRRLQVNVQSIDGPDADDWLVIEAVDVTDVLATERRVVDTLAELERGRARTRAVLDASPHLVAAVDTDGRLTHANAGWLEFADSSEGDVVDSGPGADLWAQALAGDTVTDTVQVEAEGRTRWMDLTLAPIVDRWGGVSGAVLVGSDATSRVDADRIRDALARADLGMVRVDATGRAILSRGAETVLGGPVETLDDLARATIDPKGAAEAIGISLESPGVTVDFHSTARATGRAVRLRGRSAASERGLEFVGVLHGEPARASSADRWKDLLQAAGWGGLDDAAERVDPDVSPEGIAPDRPERQAAARDAVRETDGSAPLADLVRQVTEALGVPVSLVSLVDDQRQVFAGQAGLADADPRETPLTHSFCQYVARERRPLVVPDARSSPLVADNPAVDDLGVAAYLGAPIAAPDGHVIGALCAIDHDPHAWTDDDLRVLSSFAAVVSAQLADRPPTSP